MSSSDEDKEEQQCIINDVTGLPTLTMAEKKKAWSGSMGLVAGIAIFGRVIGFVIAYAIFYFGATIDPVLTKLNLINPNIGYLYLAVGVFSIMGSLLNNLPMIWKGQVMPGNAGNLRSNMAIFRVNAAQGETQFPAVVLQEDGDVGRYNRSNRALAHFNENGLTFALTAIAAGIVFPFPVFVLTCIYAVARIWYQIAYTTGGYGIGCCKHGVPFMVFGALVTPTMELLVFIAGAKLLMA